MSSDAAVRAVRRGIQANIWWATAAALTALAAVEIAQGKWDVLPPAARIAVVALVLGPLPLVRSAPVGTTATIVVSADAILLGWGAPRSLALFFVTWLAAFAAMAYGPAGWRSRLPLGVLVASLVVVTDAASRGGWAWSDFVFSAMLFGFSAALGLGMAGHIRRSAVAEDEARLARDRAADAAAVERARIARDLHDVVAHGVSLMVVQAAAAGNVLDRDRVQARAALRAVEAVGQRTLGELRRMLDVMRGDPLGSPLPQPGLAALGGLADDARRAGTEVRLRVDVDARTVPAGVDVTAYRIVQEALTNVRRHAPGTLAEVGIWQSGDELHLEVVNEAGPRPAKAAAGRAGYGLVGMRERAALYSGRVDAGPTDSGDWRVYARLGLGTHPSFPAPAAKAPARGATTGRGRTP